MDRTPRHIDKFVGKRVRLQREILGVSETGLAAKLGVTTEELQKYESGAIRIGPRQLLEITKIFQVSLSHFFEGFARWGAAQGPKDAA